MPIAEFHRRIHGGVGLEGFLSRNATFQHIAVGSGVVGGESIHEARCLVYQRAEGVNDTLAADVSGLAAIEKLCQIDEVRLLPNQVTPHIRRRFCRIRRCHLHPPYAVESLTSGNLTSHLSGRLKPEQGAFQNLRMSPQSKLRLMPPDHLQMELTEPGVISQPCLLRRGVATVVHSKQVLRQHHPPFQLTGTGI